MFKFLLTLLVGFALFSLAACTPEMRETFGGVFDLQAKLADRFQEGSPNINIGGKYLTVSFVNSRLGDLPAAEKAAKAREIAVFVKDSYANIKDVEQIAVVFAVQKNYIVFNYWSNLDAHRFAVKELNEAPAATR